MATQVQFRRGTASQHNGFTGATAEITVNTTNKSLHVHDGTTAGGFELARKNLSNVSGVGILTATTFSGNLTGNVTGDLTGNVTGVAATFSGNVTVGGVLTYQDVTNVDSIGLVTARSGVRVTSGGINVSSGGINVSSGIITSTNGFSGNVTGNLTGNVTGNVTGTATSTTNIPNLSGDVTSVNKVTTLATVNSNVGTFGSGGAIPSITVNAKGLITGVTTSAIVSGITITNDTATNATRYLTFTSATSGSISGQNVSSTKLTFNPSTGTLESTNYNSTSDENLKDNIKTIDNAVGIVNQIRGVEFTWKESNQESLGVIAQEVETVLPQLVTENDHKSVNYNGLIGVLIEAVKEQQKQIESLTERIKVLES